MQLTGKAAGLIAAGVGWSLLAIGLGLDHAGLRFGASVTTVGGWVIATGLAVAVIGATERGFGALDRFFGEILARTRRASPRIEPSFELPQHLPAALAPPMGAGAAAAVGHDTRPSAQAPIYDGAPHDHRPLAQESRAPAYDPRAFEPERRALAQGRRAPAQDQRVLAQQDPRALGHDRPALAQAPRAPLRDPRPLSQPNAYADAYDEGYDDEPFEKVAQRAAMGARAAQDRPTSRPEAAARPAPYPLPAAAPPRQRAALDPDAYPIDAPQPARPAPAEAREDARAAPRGERAPMAGAEPRAMRRAPAPSDPMRAFEELLDWAALDARNRAAPSAEPASAYYPSPAAPANLDSPRAAVIEEGEIAGHAYRILADLTVEVDTLLGARIFETMEAARRFVGAPDRGGARHGHRSVA